MIDYSPSWKSTNFDEVLISLIEKTAAWFYHEYQYVRPHRDKIRFIRNKSHLYKPLRWGNNACSLLSWEQLRHILYGKDETVAGIADGWCSLELDPEKRKNFTEHLPRYDQLICTFLPGEPYQNYIREKAVYILSRRAASVQNDVKSFQSWLWTILIR